MAGETKDGVAGNSDRVEIMQLLTLTVLSPATVKIGWFWLRDDRIREHTRRAEEPTLI